MVRMIAALLIFAVVVLPVAEYASRPSYDSHASSMRHVPRLPPGGARVAIETTSDSTSAVPMRPVGLAPALTSVDRPARPLAAPFIPPRG